MKPRSRRGSGMVECVVAAMVLIPIALCLLDLIVIVIANSMNDTYCKNAARAGANQSKGGAAYQAALTSMASFKPSSIVTKLDIETLDYSNGAVTCKTRMVVHLPVPFPGYSDLVYMAEDVEPIVAPEQ